MFDVIEQPNLNDAFLAHPKCMLVGLNGRR